MSRPSRDRGTIIILALWIIALLSLFAVGLGYRATIELRLTGLYTDKIKASYAAQQGVNTVFFHIANDRQRKYDAYNESWGNNPEAFFEWEIDEGVKVTASHQAEDTDGHLVDLYGAADEQAKLNLNVLPESIMDSKYWKENFSIDEEFIEVLEHWRTKGSGEKDLDAWYESTYDYEARHGPIQILEELHFLKNFFTTSSEKNKNRAKLKDIVTFYGDGTVNFNTVTRPVLEALFAKQSEQKDMGRSERNELIDMIIEYRNGDDGLPGTQDDQLFEDANIETAIGTHEASKITMLNWLRTKRLVGFKSDFFRIDVDVDFEEKKLQRHVTAVVTRSRQMALDQQKEREESRSVTIADDSSEQLDTMRIIKYFEE